MKRKQTILDCTDPDLGNMEANMTAETTTPKYPPSQPFDEFLTGGMAFGWGQALPCVLSFVALVTLVVFGRRISERFKIILVGAPSLIAGLVVFLSLKDTLYYALHGHMRVVHGEIESCRTMIIVVTLTGAISLLVAAMNTSETKPRQRNKPNKAVKDDLNRTSD